MALPEGAAAEGFGLHPVLLDAALHAAAVGIAEGGAPGGAAVFLAGVSLHAARAVMARVRLEPLPGGHGVCVQWLTAPGRRLPRWRPWPARPAPAGQLRDELAAREHESLLWLRWAETPGCGRLPRLAGVLRGGRG